MTKFMKESWVKMSPSERTHGYSLMTCCHGNHTSTYTAKQELRKVRIFPLIQRLSNETPRCHHFSALYRSYKFEDWINLILTNTNRETPMRKWMTVARLPGTLSRQAGSPVYNVSVNMQSLQTWIKARDPLCIAADLSSYPSCLYPTLIILLVRFWKSKRYQLDQIVPVSVSMVPNSTKAIFQR